MAGTFWERMVFFSLSIAGCAPLAAPRLHVQYALDPRERPDGIGCFYDCLRSLDEEVRNNCLALCPGVETSSTRHPCGPGTPLLCRSSLEPPPCYPAPIDREGYQEAESSSDGNFVFDLIGAIFDAVNDDADDDDDDRRQTARAESAPRRSGPPARIRAKPERDDRSRTPPKRSTIRVP